MSDQRVLRLLDRGPLLGPELTRAVAVHWWQTSAVAYPRLHDLENQGLISSRRLDTGVRLYSITEAGRSRLTPADDRQRTTPLIRRLVAWFKGPR